MADKKPRLRDPVREQQMWKVYIQSEDDGTKNWKHNWGWILDEYKDLQAKLAGMTEKSTFLAAVKKEVKEDDRRLSKIPESTNHFYGWVAKEEDFNLEIYGSDYFKALALPDIYKLINTNIDK